MKITFEKKKNENDHLVFIYKDKLLVRENWDLEIDWNSKK